MFTLLTTNEMLEYYNVNCYCKLAGCFIFVQGLVLFPIENSVLTFDLKLYRNGELDEFK
jgi:hypothetical protein